MLQAEALSQELHTSGRVLATGRMQLPRGDHTTARLHRDWLRLVAAQSHKPLTRIAKEIGIAPSTLTRPLTEGDQGTSTLHATTIEKISAHTGIAPPAAATPAPRRPLRGMAEEAVPFETADQAIRKAVDALIAGRNGFVAWTLKTRSLEAAGFLSGDIALLDLNATAGPGDAVCAQVYDWHGDSHETVWRIYDPPILLGAAYDFSLRPKPLIVDNDRVVIKGVITGMLRPQCKAA